MDTSLTFDDVSFFFYKDSKVCCSIGENAGVRFLHRSMNSAVANECVKVCQTKGELISHLLEVED